MAAPVPLGFHDPSVAPPADEQAWRTWAQDYITALQLQLATAQAQLASLSGAVVESSPSLLQTDPASRLLAQHPQPVVQLSADGQVQYANDAATTVAAQAGEELAWHQGPLQALAQAALRTNTSQQQEVYVAGQCYVAQATPTAEGVVALYLTKLMAARSSETISSAPSDFYETILQQLPVEVAVFDTEHRYCFVNTNGIRDADMRNWVIGHDDFAYFTHFQRPQELALQRQQSFEQAVQTRTPVMWEEVQETATGPQHMQRHFLPVFAPDGSLRMMVGMGVDITERRQVEQQLAAQRAFYEFVLDQLPCDVGVFDDQFRYLFVNASGIKDPEMRKWVIGKDNFDYFARTQRPIAMAHERHAQLERAVQNKDLVTYEETFLRPDGDRHLYRCLQPVFRPDGSLHMILGYGLDVTERVATERALRHAKLAAESAVRAREIFLANMSHEIRTPMNAILGMSQLLAKTPLTPIQTSYQQAITTSADNLLVIINDILDLSKLEAGKMVLEQVGFDPAQLLTQVKQTLHYKAEEKGLCLRAEAGPGLPPVLLGDPYRVTQVLLNLAGNAIKFTEKGEVVISCELAADAPHGSVDVLFRVTDTGVGIEPAFLAHIFQEFSQEDASVTRKFGGTGLGLPICRNLVKLMGGDMQLESEKHRGTVTQFTLRLPIGGEQDLLPQVLLTEDSPLRQHLRHKQVLLVEDNRFNRQIAKTFLQQAQVQVTEAEHGEQAVALAQEQAFDLILMDIQMPVLDGYGATAALRQQLQLTTPIVALTANAIKGEREKCLAAGMNGYLAKPFQEAELLQIVSEWVVPHAAGVGAIVGAVAPIVPPPPALYQVDELLAVGQGDQSFVAFILETFVESSEEILQDLAQGLQEQDVVRLKSAAHTLRPSLSHLRMHHLLPAVTELDQWQGEFQLEPLTALTACITQQLDEVMQQIKRDLVATSPLTA